MPKHKKTTRLIFECPHCAHAFYRRVGGMDGTTRCPKCAHKFGRKEGFKEGDEAALARAQVLKRKLVNNSVHYRPAASPQDSTTGALIRGDQIPVSVAEAAFKGEAVKRGWKPHRPSWPDFLVETPDGMIGVEVKSPKDEVSKTQWQTFDMLESIGMKIFIWKSFSSQRREMIPWAEFKTRAVRETADQREALAALSRQAIRTNPKEAILDKAESAPGGQVEVEAPKDVPPVSYKGNLKLF